ncbi:MAG: hypothetical protein WCQ41_10430 [Bacillota bacterium]
MKNGKKTEEFGLWLTQYLKPKSQYPVFYDHGNQQKDQTVVAIKGFFGDKVTNRNRLADVDVMVVNNDNEVILLIEIEESKMSPKNLIGDIFTAMMCNRFAVRIKKENKYFDVSSKTRLIVAGVVPNQGNERDIIIDRIMPRLQKFHKPNDTLQIDKIKIVTGKDVSETLEKLKNEVRSVFTMG